MAAELWLDSTEGWLAVVDRQSQYAMVERFHLRSTKNYPGRLPSSSGPMAGNPAEQ